MLSQIKILLKKLPIVSKTRAYKHYNKSGYQNEDISNGDANHVVAILEPRLWQDYRENIAEFESVPWTIDYVLDSMSYLNEDLVGLSVATRLISPDADKGNILYGVTIFQISDGEFLFPLH